MRHQALPEQPDLMRFVRCAADDRKTFYDGAMLWTAAV
jgi:hypothetical protein